MILKRDSRALVVSCNDIGITKSIEMLYLNKWKWIKTVDLFGIITYQFSAKKTYKMFLEQYENDLRWKRLKQRYYNGELDSVFKDLQQWNNN